jgi:two-component system, LuxR family, sensor kinase FixL
MGISAERIESRGSGTQKRGNSELPERAVGAVLGHELSQPLSALLLYLQSVRHSVHGREPLLEKAYREAERAVAIVLSMRRFAERRPPLCRPADLAPLVDEAVALAEIGKPAGIRLVRADAAAPKVWVDAVQIQQVVVNLVRNALQTVAGRVNPEIRVSIGEHEGMAELMVEDNGPGVTPEERARVFEAFVSGTRHGLGLGLGLAISRAIAEGHSGALELAERPAGSGAAFVLRLPLFDPLGVVAAHQLERRRKQ